MMVVFVSQCQKKALKKTRRVLDTFANRIGDNTWQTIITQEGLLAVKKLLRKTASKNTAVSCHWIRARARVDLVWVVGNKNKFNAQGVVPVNGTAISRAYRDDLADWKYLPVIQSLTSIAALLHDWGKATARFQKKLSKDYKGKQGDALRHEWVSCLLLRKLIETAGLASDCGWLTKLANGEINESLIQELDLQEIQKPLSQLPPIAQMVMWLIVTHHRMPLQKVKNKELENEWKGVAASSMGELFRYISQDWGYWNESVKETLQDCLYFPSGLLTTAKPWVSKLKRWAKKLLDQEFLIQEIVQEGLYRPILHHARLCLMLGDHYFSSLSLEESKKWEGTVELIANTQKDGSPKQLLDQHLVGVYQHAKNNVNKLPQLEKELPVTNNVDALKRKSPEKFGWQDKAANTVRDWVVQQNAKVRGFFAVNMASTGCGKTFGNAKIMLALSENNDNLRYILALGLRTLTLQTGDEYRRRIFQDSEGNDLAVLIGSKAIVELHNQNRKIQEETDLNQERGSDSRESLMEEGDEVFYEGDMLEDVLITVLRDNKARKFLYAPILTCTIDHIMAATETTRGGRYILPCLRLMSSDLVIDEVDDFSGSDAIAIGRLIHLAGMLGRNVMISSATIPPSLAEGYFNCYREGWQLFAKTRNASMTIGCAWIDEFKTTVFDNHELERGQSNVQYAQAHEQFVKKRVSQLAKQPANRKADIVDCGDVINQDLSGDNKKKQAVYFNIIAEAALTKHQLHHQLDDVTGFKVSFGVIRIANIDPCIALALFLLDYTLQPDTVLRVMPYHSQQVLLMRHEQEKHLDSILKYKEESARTPPVFKNKIIRQHLDHLAKQDHPLVHVLFILVATPVEEVGRDHDFDWAIIEPSSYRSIIQLAGRVKRHRAGEVSTPNIGVLQYNWKTIRYGDKAYACYFSQPGYEFNGNICLNGKERKAACHTHDLSELINEKIIFKKVDAAPRIDENSAEGFGLAKLEHAVTAHWLNRYDTKGPEALQGYLTQHWYLTALPQKLNRFRNNETNIVLFRYPSENGEICFLQKDEQGYLIRDNVYHEPINRVAEYRIQEFTLTSKQKERLWLLRDYQKFLSDQSDQIGVDLLTASIRYGELLIREQGEVEMVPSYFYNDQLGLFRNERG